ncbi:MAG: hypothetical protein V3V08_19630, partial [Nannocystaceae bacterium]
MAYPQHRPRIVLFAGLTAIVVGACTAPDLADGGDEENPSSDGYFPPLDPGKDDDVVGGGGPDDGLPDDGLPDDGLPDDGLPDDGDPGDGWDSKGGDDCEYCNVPRPQAMSLDLTGAVGLAVVSEEGARRGRWHSQAAGLGRVIRLDH